MDSTEAAEMEGYRIALEDIAAGVGSCSVCGVEYEAGYEGPCQEPRRTYDGGLMVRCSGVVSVRSTASKALQR